MWDTCGTHTTGHPSGTKCLGVTGWGDAAPSSSVLKRAFRRSVERMAGDSRDSRCPARATVSHSDHPNYASLSPCLPFVWPVPVEPQLSVLRLENRCWVNLAPLAMFSFAAWEIMPMIRTRLRDWVGLSPGLLVEFPSTGLIDRQHSVLWLHTFKYCIF